MVNTAFSLLRRGSLLASAEHQRSILEKPNGFPMFDERLKTSGLPPLTATSMKVLQINVGKLCNQTCRHCHVDASPDRREVMSRETAEICMRALAASDIPIVDITGGAP
jgi:sulfatase maturation enzyme AslB (radical SAM superfamily)